MKNLHHLWYVPSAVLLGVVLITGCADNQWAPSEPPQLRNQIILENSSSALRTPPIADGSVTDVNLDGAGESILDGQNSVLVGFNALGPGEHRGVYEFDVSSLPIGALVVSATLGLNLTGTRFDGTDPNLTLYAGAGNGSLDVSDFAAGSFVMGFLSNDAGQLVGFDNVLNVRVAVQQLLDAGAQFIVFVLRPNPLASGGTGALLYSSNEIGVFSDQFGPAELIVDLALPIAIDVKPGKDRNPINLDSEGVIPVAILTTDVFDATTVDPSTVHFGAAGTEAATVHSALGDVDGDRDTDMILHFKTQDTGILCGGTSVSLTGETLTGQAINGSDAIKTVGC